MVEPSPFTVREVGEPGSLRAIADFTCPKCGQHTRFKPQDEDADGGLTCPHCGLHVAVTGTRLSDFQAHLDEINASLGQFGRDVAERVQRAARKIAESETDEPVGDSPDSSSN